MTNPSNETTGPAKGERVARAEKWKDIPEYEGFYKISTLGKVKSFHNWRGTSERINRTPKYKEIWKDTQFDKDILVLSGSPKQHFNITDQETCTISENIFCEPRFTFLAESIEAHFAGKQLAQLKEALKECWELLDEAEKDEINIRDEMEKWERAYGHLLPPTQPELHSYNVEEYRK